MSTTTESRRTDDASFAYGDWLQRPVAVRVTYDHRRRGSALEHAGLAAGSSSVGTE